LAVCLVVVLYVGQAVIVAGARLVSEGHTDYDPLIVYQAILPGASIMALENIPCRWQMETGANMISLCRSFLPDRHFVMLHAYAVERIIQGVMFRVEDLRLGDLPAYWGTPTLYDYGGHSMARWTLETYEVTAFFNQPKRSNYLWIPIASIVIRHGVG
jgi:hypothetical protein